MEKFNFIVDVMNNGPIERMESFVHEEFLFSKNMECKIVVNGYQKLENWLRVTGNLKSQTLWQKMRTS